MNMFAHLKSKPEMLSANDLLEIFPISRSGIYDLLREPGFASTSAAVSSFRAMR